MVAVAKSLLEFNNQYVNEFICLSISLHYHVGVNMCGILETLLPWNIDEIVPNTLDWFKVQNIGCVTMLITVHLIGKLLAFKTLWGLLSHKIIPFNVV